MREGRVVRVTCGSDVSSHAPGSSSAEEREAKEVDVVEEVGGKMRSLMLLDRQRGSGMDICIYASS